MRALVTGAGGFVGQWLIRDLLQHEWRVSGLSYESRGVKAGPVLDAGERSRVDWRTGDVRRPADVEAAVASAAPDVVFHLAGVSFGPDAGQDPAQAYDVNVVGTVTLLHRLAAWRKANNTDPLVVVVGSAQQYAPAPTAAMPLDETAAQGPVTVYGATKVAQEIAALQMHRSGDVRVVCTRSFNHSGAGQAPEFLLPALVGRARTLKRAGGRELVIGNPGSVRDFLHVQDVVTAYRVLAERGVPGEAYNVCSGRGISVLDLAALVLREAGVDAVPVPTDTLRRSDDMPVLIGDPRKLGRDTGWQPRLTCKDIIKDLLCASPD